MSDNPLLELSEPNTLPPFDRIRPEHAVPALDAVLAQNRAELQQLLDETTPRSWATLIAPLEAMSDRLARVFAPVSHLFGVQSTAAWREAYNACLPKLTEYGLELSQSEPLYRAYQAVAARPDFAALSPARQQLIRHALRDFRLSGVALPADKKTRYREITMRLSELTTRYEENLLDSTQAWHKHVTDAAALAGMPAAARAAAADRARARGLEGWLLTLDFPSFDAVLTYADDRALREEIYRAYVTRASDQGPHDAAHDNAPLMTEILRLRHEEAQLLGYASYAELSLQSKMAESPAAVEAFLLDLARRARPHAERELASLQAYAQAQGGPEPLQSWDLAYYSERLKAEALGLSEEELRPYFPAPQVISGMFALVQKLYGIQITPIDGVATWHPAVTVYAVADERGQRIGLFYLDPYARDDKRGGAWMDECRTRHRVADAVQQPVAFLIGNFAPPRPGKPALLTHDEVLTLFHEFGHGLHHLLTQVDEAAVSGIHGVEWDAVELPSQFMENWCYARESLSLFARHFETGAPLPDQLLDKLRESRRFQSALATLRQVEFALFDLRLHQGAPPADLDAVMATLDAVRAEVAVIRPPQWNRFPNSFSHIFAGGYAAGYYSYKWAEVLSSDAFSAFEEAPQLLSAEVGARFREQVLAVGGSRDAIDSYTAFRGRAPSVDALLRHAGIAEAA